MATKKDEKGEDPREEGQENTGQENLENQIEKRNLPKPKAKPAKVKKKHPPYSLVDKRSVKQKLKDAQGRKN